MTGQPARPEVAALTGQQKRRQGRYICQQCETQHTTCGFHEDGSHVTVNDRLDLAHDILGILISASGPVSVFRFWELLAPVPPDREFIDFRTRAGQECAERRIELAWFVCADLPTMGYAEVIEEVTEDECSFGLAITSAGRARFRALRQVRQRQR